MPLLVVTPDTIKDKRVAQGDISSITFEILNDGEADATSLSPIVFDHPFLSLGQFALKSVNRTHGTQIGAKNLHLFQEIS